MVSLVKEDPYAAVVEAHCVSTVCSKCFKSSGSAALNHCASCRRIRYCSKECQRADWIDHKMECKFLQRCTSLTGGWPTAAIRLVSRVLMKIRRGDLGSAFNGRTFNDLVDHSDHFKEDEEYLAVQNNLHLYMSVDYPITPDVVLFVYAKIACNAFGISAEGQERKIGRGLYLGLSVHNHGCDAQAYMESDGAAKVLRAKVGVQYSKEIVISYADIYQTKSERKKFLREGYNFECSCSWCSDPEHEGWAMSIRSKCCPDSACLLKEDTKELACYKCGKIDKMTVDEAKTFNEELSGLTKELEGNGQLRMLMPDYDNFLRSQAAIYDRFAKVLSPWNMRLAFFGQTLSRMAFMAQRRPIAKKFATVHLVAFRKYLGPVHKDLADQFINAALCIGLENKEAVDLLQEGYEHALSFYGPTGAMTLAARRHLQAARLAQARVLR